MLRQLDRNKLEFIMIAAHELRTPLTVLNGYVNLMRTLPETQANPKLAEVTEGITSRTNRMHKVVNMMLDLTRIGTETLKVAADLSRSGACSLTWCSTCSRPLRNARSSLQSHTRGHAGAQRRPSFDPKGDLSIDGQCHQVHARWREDPHHRAERDGRWLSPA